MVARQETKLGMIRRRSRRLRGLKCSFYRQCWTQSGVHRLRPTNVPRLKRLWCVSFASAKNFASQNGRCYHCRERDKVALKAISGNGPVMKCGKGARALLWYLDE